ncbi:MAG TPA: polysaccharide deacetylase family protein [Acidimicrobiales bacterium]|nr:polysaccharide deacetylase family protein [Acidimicrobiales bacterium]
MSRRTLIAVMAAVLVVIIAVAVVIARSGGKGSSPTTTTTSTSTSTSTTTTTTTTSTTTTSTTTTTTPPSATTRRATTTTTAAVAPAIVVRRGNPNRMTVALTFDAGSDTGYAAPILDVLKANNIKATFGLTGKWTQANPALVARMAAEGHQLVNHSWDHPSFVDLTQAQRFDQLARAESAIASASGTSAKPWFRPPFGAEDASVRADVALAGYRYELMWTVDSWGWKGVPTDEAVQRVVDGAVPGAIFLLHVGGASSDYSGLQRMIDGLRAKGYSFATAAGVIA